MHVCPLALTHLCMCFNIVKWKGVYKETKTKVPLIEGRTAF